jgi:hypothetical protein
MKTALITIVGSIVFLLLAIGFTGYLLRLKFREKEALNFRMVEIYAWVLLALPWCVGAAKLAVAAELTIETMDMLLLCATAVCAQSCGAIINWVLRRPAESGSLSLLASVWSTFLACITGLFGLVAYWMVLLIVAWVALGVWKMLR